MRSLGPNRRMVVLKQGGEEMRRGEYLALGILLAAMGVCFISQLAVRADVEALSSSVVLDRFKDIPVEFASGEVYKREAPDMLIKSRGLNLDLTRNYRSQRTNCTAFGYGWNWSHGSRLNITSGGLFARFLA